MLVHFYMKNLFSWMASGFCTQVSNTYTHGKGSLIKVSLPVYMGVYLVGTLYFWATHVHLLVRTDMDENEYRRFSRITLRHILKEGNVSFISGCVTFSSHSWMFNNEHNSYIISTSTKYWPPKLKITSEVIHDNLKTGYNYVQ